jgi:predicted metal-dependent HD superfamily phosphohydrolase
LAGHQHPPVPDSVLAELRRRYAEPHRAYHDWRHVEALLGLF